MSSLADRLGLGSTGGPSRQSSAGRGGRPTGPTRTSSSGGRASPRGQQRPAPYAKSSTPVASTSANVNAGNVEGKWEHDLFGAESDSLAPQINTSFGKAKRSASGGVFGKALDGISSPSLSARATAKSPPQASPSSDLFGRFGLNSPSGPVNSNAGTSNGSFSPATVEGNAQERDKRLREKAQWEAELRQRDEQKRLARLQDKDRETKEQEEQRRREELLRQEALDLQVARRQTEEQEQQMRIKSSQATLVVIQNLLDGTTPEDVKAALGDFGEILTCQVLESNGDTVSMQLEFMNRGDAERAVKQLDGALADGKTLRLSIKERPKAPPVNNRPMGIPLKGTNNRQQQNVPLARNPETVIPKAQQPATSPELQTEIASSSSSSRLRSDRIASYDERATILDRPPVQHLAKTNQHRQNRPQNPRTTGKAENGDTVSLAQRFGVQPTQQRFQQQRGNGTQNQIRSKQEASGLLSRLGGASQRDDDMMDTS